MVAVTALGYALLLTAQVVIDSPKRDPDPSVCAGEVPARAQPSRVQTRRAPIDLRPLQYTEQPATRNV